MKRKKDQRDLNECPIPRDRPMFHYIGLGTLSLDSIEEKNKAREYYIINTQSRTLIYANLIKTKLERI